MRVKRAVLALSTTVVVLALGGSGSAGALACVSSRPAPKNPSQWIAVGKFSTAKPEIQSVNGRPHVAYRVCFPDIN